MIKAWKLTKARRISSALTGEGAFLFGARWNRAGTRVVYASDSLALSALEQFVHLDKAARRLQLVSLWLEIPDGVTIDILRIGDVPRDWRHEPPPLSTQELGNAWIGRGSSAILKVPSVIVPSEFNYVLNPAHIDFDRIKLAAQRPFSFNSRMWK